jgi:hypothetical protein
MAAAEGSSKYIRTADGQFQCPHCPKICEKQNTMYYHVKKNHLNDLPHECKICGPDTRFLQKSAYLRHMATVHRDVVPAPTAAPQAPAPAPAVAAPVVPEKNPYVGVEFKCTECDHTTHTKANMTIHYTRCHCHGTVPVYDKTGPCKRCERTFASSSAYYYHVGTCFAEVLPASYAKLFVSAATTTTAV